MTDVQAIALPHDDISANIRRNVKILMAGEDVRATSIYRALGMSRSVFSSRLTGVTKFSAAEVVLLARLLETSVELLAGPTDLLVAGQNWKMLMGPDLRLVPLEQAPTCSTRKGENPNQLELVPPPMLTLVRDTLEE